nr:unnamed protein product [Callosobruchus chinensis]
MKQLSIAFVNVRSLVPHFADFSYFLESQDLDIVGVSETWLNSDVPTNLLNVKNYTFLRKDRVGRGGGVGMYISNNLEFSVVLSESSFTLEELWVEVKLGKLSYVIGSLYRPPKGNVASFVDFFEDRLSQFIDVEIICGGDLNINLLNEPSNDAALFNNCIEAFDLKQVIHEPTRIGKTAITLLDVILVPESEFVLSCGTKDTSFMSDHLLVYCVLKITTDVNYSEKKYVRNLKNIDRDLLNEFLSLSPLQNLIYLPDVQQKVTYLNKILLDIFDILAPVRPVNFSNKKPPWMTYTVKSMIKLKQNAFNRFKRNKSTANWEYYKLIKNQVNTAVFSEKKRYLEFCINQNRGKSKTLWKTLSNLNICKNNKSSIPVEFSNPDELNKYFLQSSAVNSSINDDLKKYYSLNRNPKAKSVLEFHTISEDVVKENIMKIKSSAMGADQINLDMILLCLHKILPYITNIINSCILDNDFPDNWKVAKIVPLPKKQTVSSFSDIRPISILPVFSKLLEMVIESQITTYLNEYNLLPDHQSGFRAGFSCETALLNITDDIFRAVDQGQTTILVLLDYTKEFDKINHEMLISILHYTGFSETAKKLMASFLCNRRQYVVTDVVSSEGLVSCGVPQGSILGPLLFSIYTSKLGDCLERCRVHLYADDTQLYFSFQPSDRVQAELIIKEDLHKLIKYSQDHDLCINAAKSNILIFGRLKDVISPFLKITIRNDIIPVTSSARNLGLHFDNNLRFKPHVSKCIQRAYASLKTIFPHRHLLSQSIKIMLCNSLVLSHFNFCDVVYGPCLDRVDSDRIQRVQKACLRFIHGIRKFQRVSYKLKETKWLTMEDRRKLHAVNLFHKIIFYRKPPYLYQKIKYISPPPHQTTFFQRSYSFNVYWLYNQVPDSFKYLEPTLFKLKYKKFLLEF